MRTAETPAEILGEVALAMLLGGLIGLERELSRKPAGLRTHMLVAGVAALLVGLGSVMVERFSSGVSPAILRFDPMGLMGAIITGVSFLCAGTIFRLQSEQRVEGLTTAATLLMASTLGICVALREFLLATMVTFLVLVVVWVVGRIELRLHRDTLPDSAEKPIQPDIE